MKSVKARFNRFANKRGNQDRTTLSIFTEAISGQNFSERTIRIWFQVLVDKSEYAKNEKKAIIADLLEQKKC